jgi:hypothetical protein
LNEIAHTNPLWLHTSHAAKLGVRTGDLVRVETEIGYFVVRAWVTEGIKPGIVACSHHMGRWKVHETGQKQMMATVKLDHAGDRWGLKREAGVGLTNRATKTLCASGGTMSACIRTSRSRCIRIRFPECIAGTRPCACAKLTNGQVRDIHVDTAKSHEVYKKWLAQTRPRANILTNGERRPYWMLLRL